MSENVKVNNGVFTTVIATILAATAACSGWTVKTIFAMNAEQAALRTKVEDQGSRLSSIEKEGSPIIKEIRARLDSIQAGQARIESKFEEHLKETRGVKP